MRLLVVFTFLSFAAVLQARIFPVRGRTRYALSYWQAHRQCADRGAALALPSELEDARHKGYSHCNCGWLSDRTARYPMAEASRACGGKAGVHNCNWRESWDAFCFMGDQVANCSKPLGMESGEINDLQLTSSSTYHTFWNERWGAERARLNRGGVVNAWMPHHDGRNQYVEVNLEEPMAITGIVSQGVKRYLKHQYITSFKIGYSKDGNLWKYFTEGGVAKVFPANRDNNGHVRNVFNPPILAQHVRVYPHTWMRHISLRFELLGCDMSSSIRAFQPTFCLPPEMPGAWRQPGAII